jgi:hypothetical protein
MLYFAMPPTNVTSLFSRLKFPDFFVE